MKILRRILLPFTVPPLFLLVGLLPYFGTDSAAFRRRYWGLVRWCMRFLMWILDIRIVFSDTARARLLADHNSVLLCNHKSNFDVPIFLAATPPEKQLTFGAKLELTQLPFFKRGFAAAGILTVDRKNGKSALRSLTKSAAGLDPSVSLFLFPEGTRFREPGIGPLKPGGLIIAKETKRQILPMVLVGTDKILPAGAWWPRSGVVTLDVLPDTVDLNGDQGMAALAVALRQSMQTRYDALSAG